MSSDGSWCASCARSPASRYLPHCIKRTKYRSSKETSLFQWGILIVLQSLFVKVYVSLLCRHISLQLRIAAEDDSNRIYTQVRITFSAYVEKIVYLSAPSVHSVVLIVFSKVLKFGYILLFFSDEVCIS